MSGDLFSSAFSFSAVDAQMTQTVPYTSNTAPLRDAVIASRNASGSIVVQKTSVPMPIASFSFAYFADGVVAFYNNSLYASNVVWHFGDGTTSTAYSPYHRYASSGSYGVQLVVSNSRGTSTTYTWITISTVQQAANFTSTPAGLTVYFDNTSTVVGTAFWDFGDGTTGTGDNPSHTYVAAGTYPVKLTVGIFTKTANAVPYDPVDPGVYQGVSSSLLISFGFLCALNDYVTISKSGNPDYVSRYDKTTLAQFDTVSSRGSADGQVIGPKRICEDASYYYVVDQGNSRVEIFDKTTKAFVAKFGTNGEGNGNFYFPAGIEQDDTYIYVTDYKISGATFYWSRISIWNKSTNLWVAHIAGGEGANEFRRPTDIHIANGKIYIADYDNHKILVHDQTTRAYLATITIPLGAGAGQVVTGITGSFGVDANYFYIGETGGKRVQIFHESDGSYAYGFTISDVSATVIHDVGIDSNSIYVLEGDGATWKKISKYDKNGVAAKVAPTAIFSASVTSGTVPLAVVFTNASTGTGLTYLWNFGDGTTSTSANPTHTFTSSGNYLVSLAVTGNTGTTDTREMYITANEVDKTIVLPVGAAFTAGPELAAPGDTISFFATTSTSISSYAWTFGDGSAASGDSPTHVYAAAGTYTVTLTVTTVDGLTSSATRDVVIAIDTNPANNPPVGTATMSAVSGVAPASITFNASTYADVPAFFEWDFGDGAVVAGGSITRRYDTPGTYVITLRSWNTYGETETRVVLFIAGLISLSSDDDGYYIVDKQNHQILQYGVSGTFTRAFGGFGVNPGQLYNPTRLCVCRPRIGG